MRLVPFARVEEAVEEVRLRIVPLIPAKVEVPAPDWKNWSASMSPAASQLPAVVEVPAPFMVKSPPIMALAVVSKDWATVNPCKDEEAVVEVAVKLRAVTLPVNTPAPVTPKGVPGDVVPMPMLPALEMTRKVEVAPELVTLR